MPLVTMSIRMDAEIKCQFEYFCEEVGLTPTAAINIFVRTVLREGRIPFEIKGDRERHEKQMERLRSGIEQLNAGKGQEHELIEDD
ncbi:type II toxin-antitoxin system RelB/DinJ family antitoxin [Cloacibacillus sp. An23]|uniref:type II toxin-antitoxin system RelB/DinJ family antitoxin n=1 Tax=Cloacibacillus sp. An23 TaxID=1965591 RepID=UPI000B3AE071|nr:type II toxin-antitoxin system RelB/DinJ family antitoxin [Cloacibacillus sp. An23]OUO94739.1 hypothetical protein B5F39_02395 [Cloacibacillus sp. An23]